MAQAQMRWLLSVLCVLGAFVYLGREPLALANPGAAAHAGHPGPSGSTELPEGHGAHCVFCFSAAFALVPDPEPGRGRALLQPRLVVRPAGPAPGVARAGPSATRFRIDPPHGPAKGPAARSAARFTVD
ncbi:hypothetical protein J2Y00_004629 [Deinococcus soli (ex Cha et al. 2016)]|jgi:hypothetical protein|uniref:DUF2946 domain-containing protein n=3 Tax=Deinococcus TaxID=1298 RepID=A0AAE4BN65_9DEIO|nr:hypothetical protein [Deinococcus soli (ex Cha et al. 2016)]MDR6331262.1 hypothetical protein [Deinococcus soli (ex Cha et al. 2016)]MDR6754164.1 hypothetical protein [Deinococcus soli (ex Cha et al. 2016)]GGB80969.1 hypothetical protein GCM10008019_41540 [Deinococcus soli (ex Cha et al. 2016)]GGS08533.1 hypothetical protein GCM10008960_38570 [Deinococcus sedimenti]